MMTTLTPDEESWARASFSWALLPDMAHRMDACLDRLSPDALREVTLAVDVLLSALCARQLVAEVPTGVSGYHVGSRS